MKEDLEKMKKEGRDSGGCVCNRTKIVTEKIDFETLVSIRKLQVELLGSTKLYEIVDKNLRECKSHPLFVNGYHEVGDNDDDVQIF